MVFVQMMMREQDHAMDSIAGTLNTIAQQANLMGQEISEHNEYVTCLPARSSQMSDGLSTRLLTDLESNVDRTENKLGDAMLRMKKFLRDSEEKGSGWCIVILMIVLMALLLAVILL